MLKPLKTKYLSKLKKAAPVLGLSMAAVALAEFQIPSNPAYNTDLYYVVGGYALNQENISEHNTDAVGADLRVNRYGTTTILKDGAKFEHPLTGNNLVVRDQQYNLYQFTADNNLRHFEKSLNNIDRSEKTRVGIRVIPVANGYYFDDNDAPTMSTSQNSAGEQISVQGSELLDDYLRKEVYGYTGELANSGPIYAQIVYTHPEGHQGEIKDLPGGVHLKTEMGMTHKGAYLGNGHTRNSPGNYHGDTWFGEHDVNYPAVLHVMDYKGAADATNNQFKPELFNLNAQIVQMILNEGVTFSTEDYKFDHLYTVNLENSLDYFRRWIQSEASREILRDSPLYQVYCAEHVTMVINIALNVPQNEAGYVAVWGEDGRELWQKAKNFWRNNVSTRSKAIVNIGNDLDNAIDGSYEPMWKLLGETNPTQIKKTGRSLGWKPATVADLAAAFVSTYAKWSYVGPTGATLAVLGFEKEVAKRMNLPKQDFANYITPIVSKMYQWHAAGVVAAKMSEAGQQIDDSNATQQGLITGIINALKDNTDPNQLGYSQKLYGSLTQPQLGLDAKTLGAVIDGNENREGFLTALNNVQTITLLAERVQKDAVETQSEELIEFLELAYDQFKSDTREDMKRLNAVDANDEGGSVYVVKHYYNPSLHKLLADKVYDYASEERKLFRNYPVAHVLLANQTEPTTATQANPEINNSYIVLDIHDESYFDSSEGEPVSAAGEENSTELPDGVEDNTPDDDNASSEEAPNKREQIRNRREARRNRRNGN